MAELSLEEIEMLALLCKSYVEMAKREDRMGSISASRESVLENGPA